MGDIDRITRGLDNQLRYAMDLKDPDARLRQELQYGRDALGAFKTGLSLMDAMAWRVVAGLSTKEPGTIPLRSVG